MARKHPDIIRSLVQKNRLSAAIAQVINSSLADEGRILSSQLEGLEGKVQRMVISQVEEEVQRNKIRNSLLNIASKLEIFDSYNNLDFQSNLLDKLHFEGISVPEMVQQISDNFIASLYKSFIERIDRPFLRKNIVVKVEDDDRDKYDESNYNEYDDAPTFIKLEKFRIPNKESNDDNHTDIKIPRQGILQNIIFNIKKTETWCNEISFKQAIKSRKLKELFIDIDLYISQLKYRVDSDESVELVSSNLVLNSIDKNIIIFGGPGAGKTTLLKNLCRNLIRSKNSQEKKSFLCPFVIKFRELEIPTKTTELYEYGLFNILIDAFGIYIRYPILEKDSDFAISIENHYYTTIKKIIVEFLNHCRILLIFDGFDEIANPDLKRKLEKDFVELALLLKGSNFILTSRNGEFQINLTNTDNYEICPLNDSQIQDFISNWISNKVHAKKLYKEIINSPYYDTTIRPLTLAHLCAIYDRRKVIPSKPRYIYDFVVHLLLEHWDEQRGITRPSRYANFYIEKKKEFLAHLAYWMTVSLGKLEFSRAELQAGYKLIYSKHGLPKTQSRKVIQEIESHSGLIIQSGYSTFQFSHKSLHEYLTSRHLLASPLIPENSTIIRIPNEMAITVSLSSNPNQYFVNFLKNSNGLDESFWISFLGRLAIEKPDFDIGPEVIVFFYSTMDKEKLKKYPPLFETLISISKHTNIKKSYRKFQETYSKPQEFEEEVVFFHKRIDISLHERNYFPGKLIVDRKVWELFKN